MANVDRVANTEDSFVIPPVDKFHLDAYPSGVEDNRNAEPLPVGVDITRQNVEYIDVAAKVRPKKSLESSPERTSQALGGLKNIFKEAAAHAAESMEPEAPTLPQVDASREAEVKEAFPVDRGIQRGEPHVEPHDVATGPLVREDKGVMVGEDRLPNGRYEADTPKTLTSEARGTESWLRRITESVANSVADAVNHDGPDV